MNARTAATLMGLTVCGLVVAYAQIADARLDSSLQPGPRLIAIGEAGDSAFGISATLSAKGTTALVGGSSDAGSIGAAWAFTRSGTVWRQQDRKLTATGETDTGRFGLRVALSGDGNTALIAAPLENGGGGAAWVFTRSGSTWRQGAKLTPAHEAGASSFGESVALSADGNTALVGGPTDNLGAGAAWVFTRSGSAWKQQGTKLTGAGEVGPGRLGSSVALSGNGKVAALGGPLDGNGVGAVWVFTQAGSSWSEQGSKLTIKGAKGQAQFGTSVALAAAGTTVLVGAPVDDLDIGTAWVFTRNGSDWRQQGNKLKPPGTTGTVQFGGSVALSGNGSTALIGGASDNGDVGTGAAWVFTRNGSAWSQQGKALTGRHESGPGGFGSSVAISTDGSTALIGGYNDGGGAGAVWEYHL